MSVSTHEQGCRCIACVMFRSVSARGNANWRRGGSAPGYAITLWERELIKRARMRRARAREIVPKGALPQLTPCEAREALAQWSREIRDVRG